MAVPWGQYDDSRVVNIGMNRWLFKPEIGVSKASGPWTLEFTAAATFFTDNTNFYGGSTRSQDPIYSFQGHAIYSFRSGIWASFDVNYFTGGRTTLDGMRGNDFQQNWRVGGTLALPVDLHNSIKLYASSGVSARTDNSFDSSASPGSTAGAAGSDAQPSRTARRGRPQRARAGSVASGIN